MYQSYTVFSPENVEPRVFSTSGPVRVLVSGLAGDDYVEFLMVQEIAERANFTSNGCQVYAPSKAEISSAIQYTIGNCKPTLNRDRQIIYIAEPGKFLPVVHTSDSDGDILIVVQPVSHRNFLAAELGIEPCEPVRKPEACVDKTFKWTGRERANGENIEREHISNCGNIEWIFERKILWWETSVTRCSTANILEIQEENELGHLRWKATGQPCGYSPSLPVMIHDDCGDCYTGFMYHPDELRDPRATVAIENCSGSIKGYIYPTPATGRTLAFKDCSGVVYGYLANRSDTAPTPCAPTSCCSEVVKVEMIQPKMDIQPEEMVPLEPTPFVPILDPVELLDEEYFLSLKKL